MARPAAPLPDPIGEPDIGPGRKVEGLGAHSDHLPAPAVQLQRATQDVGVPAELILPEAMAHHHHHGSPLNRVLPADLPAQRGCEPEGPEELPGDLGRPHQAGLAVPRPRRFVAGVAHDHVEGVRRLDVEEVHSGHAAVGPGGIALPSHPDRDDPVRLRVREGGEEDRVHHAEDGGVRPDADGQRRHRDQGEARPAEESAAGEPEVLAEGVRHPSAPARPGHPHSAPRPTAVARRRHSPPSRRRRVVVQAPPPAGRPAPFPGRAGQHIPQAPQESPDRRPAPPRLRSAQAVVEGGANVGSEPPPEAGREGQQGDGHEQPRQPTEKAGGRRGRGRAHRAESGRRSRSRARATTSRSRPASSAAVVRPSAVRR